MSLPNYFCEEIEVEEYGKEDHMKVHTLSHIMLPDHGYLVTLSTCARGKVIGLSIVNLHWHKNCHT